MRVSSKVELSRERIDDKTMRIFTKKIKKNVFFSRLIFTSGQNLYCELSPKSVGYFFSFLTTTQVDESEFESGIVKRENEC